MKFELHHLIKVADPYKNCGPEMRHDRTGAITVDVFVALSDSQVYKYNIYVLHKV